MRPPRFAHARPARIAALAAALALTVAACTSAGTVTSLTTSGAAAVTSAESDWDAVLAQANGQTVNWYMYGGDDTLNAFVAGYVADQLGKVGVTLNQVKITDTVDAVNKVLGEVQAGRTTDGSVDAIWVNGENFATGVQANLWSCGWDKTLPNSQFVDFTDPAVANDFGIPVKGCEAVWQQADSALVYDSAKLDTADVASMSTLFDWARANPGQFTYPAPPDFTGSMAVRTILYDTIGGPTTLSGPFDETNYTNATAKLWPRLKDIAGSLWRGGQTYPQSQSAVEKLYSDGEISAFFTYGPGAVGDQVDKGLYPASTRQAVLAGGNIGNRSFVAIPANAAHQAAATVLANVLQDPQTQLELLTVKGVYPGIDVTKTSPDVQAQFAAVPVHPSVLPLTALTENAQPELAAEYLTRIEQDWTTNVLQQQ
ncbi:MAG TPA: ABC transporter substrate-binding protein [Mycobacterium sp.]